MMILFLKRYVSWHRLLVTKNTKFEIEAYNVTLTCHLFCEWGAQIHRGEMIRPKHEVQLYVEWTWSRYDMETLSALASPYEENTPVTGCFSRKGPVMRNSPDPGVLKITTKTVKSKNDNKDGDGNGDDNIVILIWYYIL